MKRTRPSASATESMGPEVRVPEIPARPFPGQHGAEQWAPWINTAMAEQDIMVLQRNTSTGRPTGDEKFVEEMEVRLERILKRQKPGPKSKGEIDNHTPDMFGEFL